MFVDRFRPAACLSLLTALLVATLSGCGTGGTVPMEGAAKLQLAGTVMGGQQPVSGAAIQIYAAGTASDQSAATPLITGSAVTGATGGFNITGSYTCPAPDSQVYISAEGGNPGLSGSVNNTAIVLIAALGPCGGLSGMSRVSINEVTTVGSLYALAPFAQGFRNIGASSADQAMLTADFATVNQLVDVAHGTSPGPTPSGSFTVPASKINTLADDIAPCVNSPGGVAGDNSNCGNLFTYATPPGGSAPTNVADAVLNIASFPYQNVSQIFNLLNSSAPFMPTVSTPGPSDWVILPLPTITVTPASSPVGTGASATGTITLGQPAPANGLVVTLSSADTTIVTVGSPVTLAAGATSASFTYSGVATGSTTLKAVASNYAQGTASVSATASSVVLGTLATQTPGVSVDLPVSLSSVAAADTTVTLSSNNSAISVSPTSVTVLAGHTTPTSNPHISTNQLGTAVITATASGYAQATTTVNVALTASLSAAVSIVPGSTSTTTLTLNGAAPTGGLTMSLASSNTAAATVPASVTVAAGSTSATFTVTAVAAGTATITASAQYVNSPTQSVTVGASINAIDQFSGVNMYTYGYFNLPQTPRSATNFTVTVGNPAILTIAKDGNTVGTSSITYSGVSTGGTIYYTLQGQSRGSTTVTVSAPGYASTTTNVAVYPAGIYYYSIGNFSTTNLSSPTNIQMNAAILDPNSLNPIGGPSALVNPGLLPLAVTLVSSNTAVGTISAASFTNQTYPTASFTPIAVGTTTLSITQPAGFTTPAYQPAITATVTQAAINFADMSTGANVLTYPSFGLNQNPATATDFTITVADPTIATVAKDGATTGTASVVIHGVTTSGTYYFTLQGQKVGTTTATISASGYPSVTVNVTVNPAGFYYATGNFSTTTFSSANNVQLNLSMLDPTSFSPTGGYVQLNPGLQPLTLSLVSSNTSVGTITTATFQNNNNYAYASFTPAGAGTSTLSLTQPVGFTVPSYQPTITATVTAPSIAASDSGTGVKLQGYNSWYLSVAPPSPVTVTLTVADPTIATIAPDNATVGTRTLTYANNSGGRFYFWVQGQKYGTTTMTFSAPGFATQTQTINVQRSTVYFGQASASTTTFSSPSGQTVALAVISDNGGPQYFAVPNPDASPMVVSVNSSNTGVGTIDGTATFTSTGQPVAYPNFTPGSAGTTTLSLSNLPAGLTPATYQATETVTVSAPTIGVGDSYTGLHGQTQGYYYLPINPPAGVTVTLTVNNPSVGVISKDPTVAGSQTLTFTNVTDGTRLYFYFQGLSLGSTTITTTAPGYQTAVANAYVENSGLILNSGNLNTTVGSTTANVQFGLWAIRSDGNIDYPILSGPDAGSLSVGGNSSNPSVGNITTTKLPVGVQYFNVPFTPGSAGMTTVTIVPPSGFATPINPSYTSFTATVQ